MKALILVDIQNDFMPGGNLAVPEGDKIVPIINELMDKFDLVIAAMDWHPRGHKSFASSHYGKKPGDVIELNGCRQILWPEHCIQNTIGSQIHNDIVTKKITKIIYKGTNINIDSYSAFLENDKKHTTGLDIYLKNNRIRDIYIAGLATDYCVKYTAIDGSEAGFNVFLIKEACRGVELNNGDITKAVNEMSKYDIKFISKNEF
ncbi:MAG: bifunctional nicotinamidase/pyrazinamidase [Victivallales bacterium]|nr:bifunctional nicotinamidase/pyrazinamidase [Victivallales bacterium]MCF7888565.1 bifunctional nicotinamidase/pyrazinamidase [Victivallales bacterium]